MRHFIFFSIILAFACSHSYSQDFIDTEGKDFWLTFLPNYHNDRFANSTDSLMIFVSSKVPTKGIITYSDRSGKVFTKNFTINDPSKIYSFSITHYNYELLGFNQSGTIIGDSQNEQKAKQSFHVESDDEVTVYALNQASLTSEAFLVIPTDALGEEYYVLAYNSDGDASSSTINSSSTPSQFSIVATEDNTNITITPKAPTFANGLKIQNITLAKGEVYLVQALVDNKNNRQSDMTGSFVKANKPIAVFAGQQRATVPVGDISSPSRDCLIEQMIPLKSWGKNAIIVPFAQPPTITSRGTDLFRILAANNNTEVKINGAIIKLNAGQFFESILDEALYMESNEPILVAQYKKTAKSNNLPDNYSDPLMLIIPPVEQYISSYRVINAQGRSERGNVFFQAYDKQYITIIGDKLAVSNLTIDGIAKPVTDFKQVEKTGYYWANFVVSDGVHSLASLGKFAAFVYGFGEANSYGYLGGMGLVILDLVPPRIYSALDCFHTDLTVTDSTLTDSKIASVTVENVDNVNVSVPQFKPYQSMVKFQADLVNQFLDGSFVVIAVDSVLSESRKAIEIPGFTVGLEPNYSPDLASLDLNFGVKNQNCFDIVFYNYGKHIRQVSKYKFKNNNDKVIANFTGPFLLQPGESRTITFCTTSPKDTTWTDTLILGNDCVERDIAAYNFAFVSDTSAPRFDAQADECNTLFTYRFREDSPFDLGIDSLQIISLVNCSIANQTRTGTSELEITIVVANSYLDAYFEIVVTDLSGLETVIKKEIPGFTLALGNAPDSVNLEFGLTPISNMSKKTLSLTNYGKYTISLSDIYLNYNTIFSIPQSQMPLIILAGETRELEICFTPTSSRSAFIWDTLSFGMNCLLKRVPLEGEPEDFRLTVGSRCDIPIVFTSDTLQGSVSILPSPIINGGYVQINSPIQTSVSIDLFSTQGEHILNICTNKNIKGTEQISFETNNIATGVYFLKVQMNNSVKHLPIIIEK